MKKAQFISFHLYICFIKFVSLFYFVSLFMFLLYLIICIKHKNACTLMHLQIDALYSFN